MIANNAVMEKGFTLTNDKLSDNVSTCSIDTYFPVKSLVDLVGGTLSLERDLFFDDVFALGSGGDIYGNGYTIHFPSSEYIVGIPSSADRGGEITMLDSTSTLLSNVYSTDWSHDDKYLTLGRTSAGTNIPIYSFDNETLSSKLATVAPFVNVRMVRWHPSEYYVAAALESAAAGAGETNVQVYKYTPLSSLTLTGSGRLAEGSTGMGVSWSPNGKYLAATSGTTSNKIKIYSFSESDGTITFLDESYFSTDGNGSTNSLDWNLDGDKIAFSTDIGNILVYDFDGSSLTISTSIHVAGATSVEEVSWNKNIQYKDLLAVAVIGTAKNGIVYRYQNNTLTEIASTTYEVDFQAIDWAPEGNRLVFGRSGGAGLQFIVMYFDPNLEEIYLVDSIEIATNPCVAVKFSHDGKYIALGRNVGNPYFSVWKMDQKDMLFDNTNLDFNSDSEFIVTTTFSGLCTINGNGHKVYLNEDALLTVSSGAQLKFQNLELVGLKNSNFRCLADDAKVIFEDCILTITSDYTFDTGSILFKGDVVISGTNKFIYSSSWSSTIDQYSTLIVNKGATFSYAPSVAQRDLMYMEDDTSSLYLDNCTLHSTTTGLRLTRGILFIENVVTLDADGDDRSEAICFGNVNYTTSDLEINILAGANLDIYGRLEYENSN